MSLRHMLVAIAGVIDSAIGYVCNALMVIAGLGLLTLLTAVVVLRYFFHTGFSFAPDLSELLFAIFVMAGVVQAARLGVHVATQILISVLNDTWRRILAVAIHAVTAAAYIQLSWYALQNAIIAHDQTTPVLQIPWSVGYGILATGLCFVALLSVTAIIRYTLGGEEVVVNLADAEASSS